MSDIKSTDQAGYIVFPKRVRLVVVGAAIAAVFGFGGWIAVMQTGVSEAKAAASEARDDVEDVKESVRRIERHLCLECRAEKLIDCTDICIERRSLRLEAR